MAPPGTKIITHEKTNQRYKWRKLGLSVWYISPALEKYRCYKVSVTEKRSERISDIMEFSPQNVRMPIVLSADAAALAARDLLKAF